MHPKANGILILAFCLCACGTHKTNPALWHKGLGAEPNLLSKQVNFRKDQQQSPLPLHFHFSFSIQQRLKLDIHIKRRNTVILGGIGKLKELHVNLATYNYFVLTYTVQEIVAYQPHLYLRQVAF